ncbi:hypothetical protein, partial [Nonomuraea maheshkhaliensis]
LVSVAAVHPDPEAVRRDLAAVDTRLDLAEGRRPTLTVVLSGRHGPVTLT